MAKLEAATAKLRASSQATSRSSCKQNRNAKRGKGGFDTYRNAVRVLLADALGLGLALLEGVLVLELGSHIGRMR